jgi:hypothetical protein
MNFLIFQKVILFFFLRLFNLLDFSFNHLNLQNQDDKCYLNVNNKQK